MMVAIEIVGELLFLILNKVMQCQISIAGVCGVSIAVDLCSNGVIAQSVLSSFPIPLLLIRSLWIIYGDSCWMAFHDLNYFFRERDGWLTTTAMVIKICVAHYNVP